MASCDLDQDFMTSLLLIALVLTFTTTSLERELHSLSTGTCLQLLKLRHTNHLNHLSILFVSGFSPSFRARDLAWEFER
jgi:hypothetical protein